MQVVLAFVLFAGAATAGLVLLLNATLQRLSRHEFVALAESNAQFIRDSNLPATDKLASYMSQLLGLKAQFGGATNIPPDHDFITVPVRPGTDLTLARERPTWRGLLTRPIAIISLLIFWSLWFGLAWAVAIPYLRAERLAMFGGIATSLAHEIRNPISAIRLHSQLLQETNPEPATLMLNEAVRIEDIVNQWMFLARPAPPRVEEVCVCALLEGTARTLEPSSRHARVNVIIDADAAWKLSVDRRRMEQVFHNIIRNAIQAMPGGGTLTITARAGTITFADTGRGFSGRALRRWRKMLYSEKEGGMGIGLNVADAVVRAHGGKLVVGNRSEGGAVVSIAL